MDEETESVVTQSYPTTYFCRKWFPTTFKHMGGSWDRNAVMRFKINQTMCMRLGLNSTGDSIRADVLGPAGVVDTADFRFADYYCQGLEDGLFVSRVMEPIFDDPDFRLDPSKSRDFQVAHCGESMSRSRIKSLSWGTGWDFKKLGEAWAGFSRGKEAMTNDILELIDIWA